MNPIQKVLLLALVLSLLTYSCKKDNGDKPYGLAVADTTKIEILQGKDGDFFAFDAQYRVIEHAGVNITQVGAKRYYGHTYYKYLPNMLIEIYVSKPFNDTIYEIDTTLLVNGIFKGDSNGTLHYTTDGFLDQVSAQLETSELILKGVYQAGNLVKEDISSSEISNKETRVYTYDQQRLDPYRLISQTRYFQFLIGSQTLAPVYGKANKNLLKSMDSNGYKTYFTYEFDSQNRITKIMVHEGFIGTHPYRTYDIKYIQ